MTSPSLPRLLSATLLATLVSLGSSGCGGPQAVPVQPSGGADPGASAPDPKAGGKADERINNAR